MRKGKLRLCCILRSQNCNECYWWKAGRPARTYIQQLCEDTGCGPEDLPETMNDREKWRERVVFLRAFNILISQNVWWNLSDLILDFCAKTSELIRASGMTWWWWWWLIQSIWWNSLTKHLHIASRGPTRNHCIHL